MAYDVFISYGHQDKLVADATCARLEARGIRCWIAPRDLIAGQSYGEGIADALRSCRALVLVFSDNANLSRHVANEVERAVHNDLPIVPLRIQDVKPAGALEYFIGSVHWLDALTPPLEQHLERLVDSVQRLIGREALSFQGSKPMAPAGSPGSPSRWGLYAVIGLLAIAASGAVGYILLDRAPAEASPGLPAVEQIVVPPVTAPPAPAPAPTQAARPGATTATRKAPRDTAPPGATSEAARPTPTPPSAQSNAGSGMTGCWLYNNMSLTMHDDGRVIGFLGGRWSEAGGNQYVITWPPSTDMIVLSPDAKSLTGSNNYAGPGVSGRRISGESRGLAGTWQWGNGLTTIFSEEGNAQNGPVSGKWTQVRGDTYRVVWNYVFVDQLTMSGDGRTVSGRNQLGMAVGGIRIPCAN